MSHLTLIDGDAGAVLSSVAFARSEFGRILSLYSTRVAEGVWRDYAIDQTPDRAVFTIFRNALESPLYTLAKRSDDRWELTSGHQRALLADSLDEALELLSRELRVIS